MENPERKLKGIGRGMFQWLLLWGAKNGIYGTSESENKLPGRTVSAVALQDVAVFRGVVCVRDSSAL